MYYGIVLVTIGSTVFSSISLRAGRFLVLILLLGTEILPSWSIPDLS